MPRSANIAVDNNFIKGLITEATALNFPENACTETFNCEFNLDGSVQRRLGFDFEHGFATKTIDRTDVVVNTYFWKNVSGNGDVSVIVKQVGDTLYFYRVDASDDFSNGAVADTVVLTPVTGATSALVAIDECQFSDGNGYLFVTHPHCDPLRVSYDIDTDVATGTVITLEIRDFDGDPDDPYDVDERPTSTLAALDNHHEYNLYNQGWNTTNLTAWDTAQTTMPSNADVMWRFKDTSNNFDASNASIARITSGNTPAPRAHHILELSNQDRNAIVTGATNTTTGIERPKTSAFFAGRVFYSGINYTKFNSNIYFTQIIENDDQYGRAYQLNDPTSEDLFDLLPSDGGVIRIPEAGTIIKLISVPGGLAVFSGNGVWFVTGSTGLGFTAVDYTVQKISTIATLTATSFVEVNGYPSWWNSDAIYVMIPTQGGLPSIQAISTDTIDSFYAEIPLTSKKFARGIYHTTDKHIRWIYRSESTDQLTQQYEFDRVLNFNVLTKAFYPWSVSDSDVKINAILTSDLAAGTVNTELVTDSAVTVTDGGQDVFVFESSGLELSPFDKYLVSYADAGSYEFTFAEKINADYVDWFSYDDTGVPFESYFVTGYKIKGQGLNKFQNNWIRVYSRLDTPVSYYFQGVWDFAATGNTGRWSSNQLVEHTDTNYSTASKRLKVRGHGLALQLKVTSAEGEPFDIVGWSAMQSGNQVP